jgi:hypothetical protein
MDNGEINKEAEEFVSDFKRFTELEGIIIRGHIVVERQLIKAIEKSVAKPDEFVPERLSFSNKLMITHMLGISDKFKTELNSLNKLRNQVAHSLEYDNKLLQLIINEVNKKKQITDKSTPIEAQLGTAISFISGAICQSSLIVKKKFLNTIVQEIMDKNNVA